MSEKINLMLVQNQRNSWWISQRFDELLTGYWSDPLEYLYEFYEVWCDGMKNGTNKVNKEQFSDCFFKNS